MVKKTLCAIILGAIVLLSAIYITSRYVLFGNAKGKILFEYQKSGQYSHIYHTNAFGFPQVRLSGNGDWDTEPVSSPDGEKIVFECQNQGGGLCIMNVDGSNRLRVPFPGLGGRFMDPNWSPDGQKIAFEHHDIYVVDLDGSNLVQLTNDAQNTDGPTWSPDGKKIAYVSIKDENWDIYIMNSDGSEPINLTNDPAMDYSPQWSKDGSYILFVSDRTGDDEIYRTNLNGSGIMNLTNNPDTDDALGTLSPSGREIAFSASDVNASPDDIDIYTMNTDGSECKRLTDTHGFDSYPVWSPDGQNIAFISGRDGNWSIYVMKADGKYQTRITFGASVSSLSWQP